MTESLEPLALRLMELLPDDWPIALRALEAVTEAEASVRGRHFSQWPDEVRQLKREGQLEEALALCLECIDAVERAAVVDHFRMPTWYTQNAAIIYRKLGQYVEEIDVLHRYSTHLFGDEEVFAPRIASAFRLLERASSRSLEAPRGLPYSPVHLEEPEGDPWRTSKTVG